jgi:predicted transposase/invertase (TIGR01784 family)
MKKPLYIDPLTDFGFKKLFTGKKNLPRLLSFINCLIEPYGQRISHITDVNTERLGDSPLDKVVIFDIAVQGHHGEQVIVEVQRCKQDHYLKRSLFYTARAISQSLQSGEDYGGVHPVYSIHILDFIPDTPGLVNDYVIDVQLRNRDGLAILESPLFVFVVLPIFAKQKPVLSQEREFWFHLLKNMGTMTTKPQNIDQESFMEFLSDAEYSRLDQKDRAAYDLRLQRYRDWNSVLSTAKNDGLKEGEQLGLKKGEQLGLKKGEQLGIKKGKEEGKTELLTQLVTGLLSDGYDIATIAKLLRVSIEHIEKIAAELT